MNIQRCTVELVFDLDEVGVSDWDDCKTRKVAVLVVMQGQKIHHGIYRNVKHISMIACVRSIGKSLVP
jgi:hypothetical protein